MPGRVRDWTESYPGLTEVQERLQGPDTRLPWRPRWSTTAPWTTWVPSRVPGASSLRTIPGKTGRKPKTSATWWASRAAWRKAFSAESWDATSAPKCSSSTRRPSTPRRPRLLEPLLRPLDSGDVPAFWRESQRGWRDSRCPAQGAGRYRIGYPEIRAETQGHLRLLVRGFDRLYARVPGSPGGGAGFQALLP